MSPPAVEPWMRWEIDRVNRSLVSHPRSLRSLLEGASLETRDGEPYDIDRPVLDRLAAACTHEEGERLRLPVNVHFPGDVDDAAYVLDALAAEVLHRIEGWGDAYPYREGKMWLPRSLAVELILRYAGALQQLML